MGKSNRHDKFTGLRTEFPFFAFEEYSCGFSGSGIFLKYHFNLADRYHFYPEYFIPDRSFFLSRDRIIPNLPSLAFHIGMIELASYWKAACAPEVRIIPHSLSSRQVSWWKSIYFKGLGEFFYLNGISTDQQSFMNIIPGNPAPPARVSFPSAEEVIIPVGGGKDSAVTLHLLGSMAGSTPLILNPRQASMQSAHIMGFSDWEIMVAERTLDPLLLELNDAGFLNGHTPFSALLAFVTLLASAITGKRYIALSNESSANEATVPGTEINHQYSKTFEFEQAFREYVAEFITDDAEYFSFLRPLNELQIARIFSGLEDFFPVFKSCNVGSKNDSWCGSCSKCLFAFIILSPYLGRDQLTKIFGKDLLDDPSLISYFEQLTGLSPEKPFDCIGTIDEVNAALGEVLKAYQGKQAPFLIDHYRQHASETNWNPDLFQQVLHKYDPNHNIPGKFEMILRRTMNG